MDLMPLKYGIRIFKNFPVTGKGLSFGAVVNFTRKESKLNYKSFQDNELYNLSTDWLNNYFNKVLSQEEQKEVMKFILPSGLNAKDARPRLIKEKNYLPSNAIYIKNGIPLYPAYYTKAPVFQDFLYKALYYSTLPVDSTVATKSESSKQEEFPLNIKRIKNLTKEKISAHDLQIFGNLLRNLSNRPDHMRFKKFLSKFRRKDASNDKKENQDSLSKITRMGYRKEATVDAVITNGTGKISINGKYFKDYFQNPLNQETVMAPFYQIGSMDFDVDANAIGGGLSGQAGALRHAIAKALAEMNEEWKQSLSEAQYLSKDRRKVERKKYARHKARKRYTWVAR